MNILQNIGLFLVDTLLSLVIGAVIIRFLLAWARAPFQNPISQFIVKVTDPMLKPLRRIIPPMGAIDTSAIVLAVILIIIKAFLVLAISGQTLPFLGVFVYAFFEFISLVIWIYIIALLIQAVLSWTGTTYNTPIGGLLDSLTAPILRPIRRVVPNIGMVDISPLVAILLLNICLIVVNGLGGLGIVG